MNTEGPPVANTLLYFNAQNIFISTESWRLQFINFSLWYEHLFLLVYSDKKLLHWTFKILLDNTFLSKRQKEANNLFDVSIDGIATIEMFIIDDPLWFFVLSSASSILGSTTQIRLRKPLLCLFRAFTHKSSGVCPPYFVLFLTVDSYVWPSLSTKLTDSNDSNCESSVKLR